MKLATTITSERGKAITKTANEYIEIDITVNKQVIGSLLIDYKDDRKDGYKLDEYIISWTRDKSSPHIDPQILEQGNI